MDNKTKFINNIYDELRFLSFDIIVDRERIYKILKNIYEEGYNWGYDEGKQEGWESSKFDFNKNE